MKCVSLMKCVLLNEVCAAHESSVSCVNESSRPLGCICVGTSTYEWGVTHKSSVSYVNESSRPLGCICVGTSMFE